MRRVYTGTAGSVETGTYTPVQRDANQVALCVTRANDLVVQGAECDASCATGVYPPVS